MFDLGFTELLVFAAIALVVLGPEKLPKAARTAGAFYAKMRRTVQQLQSEMVSELDLAETRQVMQEELARIRASEATLQQEMAALKDDLDGLQSQTDQALNTHTSLASKGSFASPIKKASNIGKRAANTAKTLDDLTQHQIPIAHRWFLLSPTERNKRMPPPPWLPRMGVDPLLNQVQPQPSRRLQRAVLSPIHDISYPTTKPLPDADRQPEPADHVHAVKQGAGS